MTIAGKIESTIAIPGGVSVSMDGNIMTVKGPRGELSRNFAHPRINVAVGSDIVVSCEYPRVKEKAMVGTYEAHIKNLIKGVTQGFTYQMKVVFSHFPMKVAVKGAQVQIDNYMGGKAPRFANIVGSSTKVKVNGADVTIESNSIEECGQTAANIEKATSRGGFDKRVFQDGIYIVEKSHKVRQ